MDNSGALNAYLIPVNSPYAQNNGQTSGYEFGYMNEDGVVSNAQIDNVQADKISAGSIQVSINLGTTGAGYLLLDGPNNRIIVNDGTVDRIIIGELP